MKGSSSFAFALFLALFAQDAVTAVPAHPPNLLQQPLSHTVSLGGTGRFEVEVNGTPPFSYQWRRNGTPIGGVDYPFWVAYPAAPGDAGTYDVVVSNAFGVVTSAVARLVVNEFAPGIAWEPLDQYACSGEHVQFQVIPGGQGSFSFQWQRNGVTIPGATGAFLVFNAVSGGDAATYNAVVSNPVGSATSAVARLVVDPEVPEIIRHPKSQLVGLGNDVLLGVDDFTCSPLGYSHQWRYHGTNLPGATSATLALSRFTNEGDYDVVITSSGGSVTSAVATLVATTAPPVIVSQPSDTTVYAGGSAYFGVAVNAAPPPSYQWWFRGAPIAGATNASHIFYVQSTNQAGGYSVVASNEFGVAVSREAQLRVLFTPPVITGEPASRGAVLGATADFRVFAGGNPAPSYQWSVNGQDIAGATNYQLLLDPVGTNDVGSYQVVVANESGSLTSRVARLTVSPPGPLDRWQWRNPRPQGNDLRHAVYGNGMWLATGDEGTLVRSADGGATWRFVSLGEIDFIRVAYGNGVFVAAGSSQFGGRLFASSDGLNWTNHSAALARNFDPVEALHGNGRFVIVGGDRSMLISTNGHDWEGHPAVGLPGPDRLAFGNGLFVGVHSGGGWFEPDLKTAIYSSSNGVDWTSSVVSTPGYPRAIAFGAGQFTICGYTNASPNGAWLVTLTSSDGSTWSPDRTAVRGWPEHVAHGGDRWVMVGNDELAGRMWSSPDGEDWTEQAKPTTNDLYFVAYGGGQFLAGGNFGNLLVSTNGTTWTPRSAGNPTNLRAVGGGPNLLVAVGNEGLLMTSPDGVAWRLEPPPTTNNLRGVAFGRGRFVAVGDRDTMGATILVSDNGSNWTRLSFPTGPGLYSVVFSGDQFLAVGDQGTAATSPDGLTWTRRTTATADRLNAVTWTGTRFVAVGRNGSIVASTNGINWQRGSVWPGGVWPFLQGVAFGNSRYVAVGQNQTIYFSDDGLNWTNNPDANFGLFFRDLEDVIFVDGRFVTVGEKGMLATSADGLIWTPHWAACGNDLRGVRHLGGRLVAVGNNETIMQSDFLGPPILHAGVLRSGEGFLFTVEGEVEREYRLEASDDLVNWEEVFTFRNTQVTTLFLDGEAETLPRRFYRVVAP